MKELSIKEKAKRYDEAIEIAKKINNEQQAQPFNIMTRVFPELKESEDERIRKELIKYFSEGREYLSLIPYNKEECVAWLEKQGESSDQIHYWTEEEIEPIISDYLRGAEHYGGMIARLRCLKPKSLEKQGEQKSANKVETKFHEGNKRN